MKKKITDPKRRQQVSKTLKNLKQHEAKAEKLLEDGVTIKVDKNLKQQYEVIKKDLLKLRDDLTQGYDMAKSLVEKKGFVKQIFSTK